MAYMPPPAPAIQQPGQRSLGSAIALGSAVAIVCAFIVGLITALTHTLFLYAAVLLGLAVGVTMRRFRQGVPAAIASAVISLIGSFLGSLIGVIIEVVREAQVPLSDVLSHISTVISIMNSKVGFFGYLMWAVAAIIGFSTVARSGRGVRVRGGQAATMPGQPYGQAQPYGQPQPPPYFGPAQPPAAGPGQAPDAPPSPGSLMPPPAG